MLHVSNRKTSGNYNEYATIIIIITQRNEASEMKY